MPQAFELSLHDVCSAANCASSVARCAFHAAHRMLQEAPFMRFTTIWNHYSSRVRPQPHLHQDWPTPAMSATAPLRRARDVVHCGTQSCYSHAVAADSALVQSGPTGQRRWCGRFGAYPRRITNERPPADTAAPTSRSCFLPKGHWVDQRVVLFCCCAAAASATAAVCHNRKH